MRSPGLAFVLALAITVGCGGGRDELDTWLTGVCVTPTGRGIAVANRFTRSADSRLIGLTTRRARQPMVIAEIA